MRFALFSPQMRLSWDALVETMSGRSRADASRTSRTCRTLLHAALPILLKDEVESGSASQLLMITFSLL